MKSWMRSRRKQQILSLILAEALSFFAAAGFRVTIRWDTVWRDMTSKAPPLPPPLSIKRRTLSIGSRSGSRQATDESNLTTSPTASESTELTTARPPLAPLPTGTQRLLHSYRSPRGSYDDAPVRSPTSAPLSARPRAWTGPSLPPFRVARLATELPRSLSQSITAESVDNVAQSLDGLGDYFSDGNLAFSGGKCRDESMPSINSGKSQRSGTPHKPIVPQQSREWENQKHLSPSTPTLCMSNSRRASSPSITAMANGNDEFDDDEDLIPRRASVDSSFGRSVEDMSPPDVGKRQRSSMYASPSAGNLSAWTAQPKRRLPGEGVRMSLQSLASISSAKAAKIPATIASTSSLIKDKAIRHIRTPSGVSKYDGPVFDILDVAPKELARQLALMDSNYFRSIPREELASVAWTGSEKYTRAPAIAATTQHFNQVALWVAEEIVASEEIQRRYNLLIHFISVAKCSMEINNFNGLRSITAGLQSAPVHRLTRTWGIVGRRQRSTFDKMCDLMSPLSNSEAYRRRLAECKPPCVPYLGTWLSDLTFLSECLKKEKNDPSRANQAADRQMQIDALLDEIARYQQGSVYNFEPIPAVQEAVLSVKFHPDYRSWIEEDHYRRSCLVEKRGAVATSPQGSNTGPTGGKQGIRSRIRGHSVSGKFAPVAQSLLDMDTSKGSVSNSGDILAGSGKIGGSTAAINGSGALSKKIGRRAFSIDIGAETERMVSGSTASGLDRHNLSVSTASANPLSNSSDVQLNRREFAPKPSSLGSRRLRRERTTGMPASRSALSGTRGHRRTKSGSAVMLYGRHEDAVEPDQNSLPSRVSTGSISDFLVSRDWDELNEEEGRDEHGNDTGSSECASRRVAGSDDVVFSSDAVIESLTGRALVNSDGSLSGRSSKSTPSRIDRWNRQSIDEQSTGTSDDRERWKQGSVLEKPESSIDMNSPDSVDADSQGAYVTVLPSLMDDVDNVDAADDRLSVDIDTITAISASYPHSPSPPAFMITPASPIHVDARTPTNFEKTDSPGSKDSPSIGHETGTTILEQVSQDHAAGALPVYEGQLYKKDELLETGLRAPVRKWVQVWAALYAEPPRLELYRCEKGLERERGSDDPNEPAGTKRESITLGRFSRSSRAGRASQASAFSSSGGDDDSARESVVGPAPRTTPPMTPGEDSPKAAETVSPMSPTIPPGPPDAKETRKKSIWRSMGGSSVSSTSLFGGGNRSRSGSTASRLARTSRILGRSSISGNGDSQSPTMRPHFQTIPLTRSSGLAIPATDYTKRKHVLRLYPGARRTLLLRAETDEDMRAWMARFDALTHRVESGG